jgi:protein TonB
MFDVYIQEQSLDPHLRRRMMGAITTAVVMTLSAGLVAWSADKMKISGVAPPQAYDLVMLSLNPPPPPPADPPQRVEPKSVGQTKTETAMKANPKPAVASAESFLEERGSTRVGTDDGTDDHDGDPTGTDDVTHRIFGSGKTGMPCLAGMACDERIPDRSPPPAPKAVTLPPGKLRTLFAPNPPQAELARTRTGMTSRRNGTVLVEFCIGTRGTVDSAKVSKRFPGDSAVDAIVRNTVKRWRFQPWVIGGKPRPTCSSVSFQIHFD